MKTAPKLGLSNGTIFAPAFGHFFWAHAVRARGSDGHQNVLSLISNSHMLENRWKQKARCLLKPNKANTTKNQNPAKNKPKQHKKTPRKLGWDTTLSDEKSPSRSVLLHDVIANLIHKCPKWPKVSKLWWVVVLHLPSHWTRVRSWFTHVHVDETAQGRRTIEIVIATIQIPENKERSLFLLQWPRWLKDDPGRNTFHSTVVK